ncbi:hypothetical protein FLGE108171_11160 [Flavobacterium gelidilacus]|jgi:hypothetical protein|uniref:hypothetical protein n=1 Tax=Flavobacterium gelidilacus TaxID=206041 RepID=UPI0003FDF231|nr:hypothetical protein [Flavobacterium gelidilacus]
MQFLSKIVLLIFILFLATPTIVSAIDESVDTSYFFNLGEEENHGAFSEIKSIPTIYSIPLVIDFEGLQKVQYSILNDRKVNSIKPTIFIEPPELV